MATVQPIEVAAGILADGDGRVLLMQRLPGKHLAGLWEFPGGKLEAGESVEHALARELEEELGVQVQVAEPLISLPWDYPGKSVRLHAWRVRSWLGEPRAREGHPLRWTPVADIDPARMPPADAPILTALRLPPHYAITPDEPLRLAGFAGRPESAGGMLSLLQVRLPAAPRERVRTAVADLLRADPHLRSRLLLNADVDLARELGVGVHLKAVQLNELDERPLANDAWVGASCHDAGGLALAARLGVDFATLSPVRATASHPQATPLGWDRFARLVADARLPVYALGGVGPGDFGRARAAGAQGVAGIRAFA